MQLVKAKIARRAGVSRSTLYAWLHDPCSVSPKTAFEIERALAELATTAPQLKIHGAHGKKKTQTLV